MRTQLSFILVLAGIILLLHPLVLWILNLNWSSGNQIWFFILYLFLAHIVTEQVLRKRNGKD